MDGGTGSEMLSPAEADWPPELRLPPPPPMPSPAPPVPQPHPPREGFDDQHFLGSMMGPAAAHPQSQPAAPTEAPVKRKRGRPRKNPEGAPPPPPPKPPAKKKDEEVVCFICFDGGNLVVCDRRFCPKVYHPACVKRDEAFFRGRGKWDCGWHICSICEKASFYKCYTCTYSLCKGCVGQSSFFSVRGSKGFCDTCYATILLIENKDGGGSKIRVDFDDKNSWEYLFKLYWLYQKGKHLLTLEELIGAKSRWTVPTAHRKEDSSSEADESYDASNDPDASFDISSRKRRRNNSSGKRGRKRQNVTTRKPEILVEDFESLPNRLPTEGMVSPSDTSWASPELLEFIGHMRNGDSSYISPPDVHLLLLEYIKQNNLRDPRKKRQIVCDTRLNNLFQKQRVAHFEMVKLLERHFHVKDNPAVNADSHQNSAKLGSDKRRKVHKDVDSELTANLEDYAAIDMHNINLIYLRRSLMEDLIDDKATLSDKIAGAFVRIRINGLGQKQNMYRLVKVLGTHKVTEHYRVGQKTTDYALEILNLDKKELITMDTISNQDFTEEECKRLRQSMKFGLVARLKVGDIYEKAKIFQSLQINDWLENEKQRLSHLRDRASETGRRKELRECVEKLQLLNTPEERARKINEVPEIHVDPRMAPDYESAEEQNFKRAADWTINRSESDLLFPERKGTQSNSMEHRQKSLDAGDHMSSLPIEDMAYRSGADINLNNTSVETASFQSSGAILSDTEPEKVWHYRDPSGNAQGPFTLLQLHHWAPYFPSDLRIWLTFESEKNSLLLTEVLKQQKDFVTPSAVTAGDESIGTGTVQDRTKSGLDANNSSSHIGYNEVHSSGLSCHSAEFSDPTKECLTAFCETSPTRSPKDAHNLHGQVQHQVNYSCTIPSLTAPDSHDQRVSSEQVDKLKDAHTVKDQLQNDSEGILSAGSVETFNSRIYSGLQKVSVLTLQQSHTDPATSLHTTEFICKEEDTCWHTTTNASICEDLHLSISLANQETCSPANTVEDRDSSSASGVPNRVGAFSSNTQQDCDCEYPSTTPKLERKQTSMNQSRPTSVTFNESGTKTCDSSISFVSESYGPPADQTGNLQPRNQTPCAKETHSSNRDITAQKGQLNEGTMTVNLLGEFSENFMATSTEEQPQCSSPIALSPWGEQNYYQNEAMDSALWGVQDDRSNDMWSMHSPTPALQASSGLRADVKDASNIVEEEITARESSTFVETLLKQGEKKIEQGNSCACRGSGALEEVKTKPSSMSGPSLDGTTKAADQSSATALEGNAKASRWKTPALLLEGITKASDWQPSDSSLGEGAKPSVWGQSNSSREEGAETSCGQKSNVSPEGNIKGSGCQRSDSSALGNTKTSGCVPSDSSAERSVKSDGWQRTSSSPEGNRKASGWHQSVRESSRANSTSGANENHKSSSSHQATTSSKNLWEAPTRQGNSIEKTFGWGEALGSAERSVKADGWQRTSSSPEGSRKVSGWHQPVRESSIANSTSGANEKHKSSSHQATTTSSKNSWEAPMRQGNSIKETVGWGEALGSAERSVKASGWQRTSSSPEENRKASGRHHSVHESSRANSTSGANENHKSFSSHQTTTTPSKNPWEAPMRQGKNIEKTVTWGEALGNNRSWNPSSGNASWGSQGGHNHDRYSHGGDSRQGNSSHSRRSDNRHDYDHHQDHDRGRSRSWSRDQDHDRGRSRSWSREPLQRGVCKYYQRGNCFKGNKCQYLHR